MVCGGVTGGVWEWLVVTIAPVSDGGRGATVVGGGVVDEAMSNQREREGGWFLLGCFAQEWCIDVLGITSIIDIKMND